MAVIATKVGECETVIMNENYGILINPQDGHELNKVLSYLVDNENIRLKMAKAFNKRVIKKYSQIEVTNMVISVYKNLIGVQE